jgi:hypothetical protein
MSLAHSLRMNDRPLPMPPHLAQPRAPEAPVEEEADRDAAVDEGPDKYDLGTLACTD